jgi:nanoRNase/pAp phosphatase (c-di-AMP/oligoRNAs hydrolase)
MIKPTLCAHDRPRAAPFAAAYFDHADGHRVFSLRSRGDFDVGALARQVGVSLGFSGGGHKAAAGFRAPLGWEGEGEP